MRILHICESPNGGANVAAWRLHQGLLQAGVDSQVLFGCSDKPFSTDPNVHVAFPGILRYYRSIRAKLEDRFIRKHTGRAIKNWTYGYCSLGLKKYLRRISPDVVNLHWVNGGVLSIKDLGEIAGTPCVWTMHDMWPITGGCHYSGTCSRYSEKCGFCPQLGSTDDEDLSRRGWNEKQQAWRKSQFNVVTPSNWLANCVRSSQIGSKESVSVIPYGLDLSTYCPGDKASARRSLGLDPDSEVILFGAASTDTPRKGGHLLVAAIESISNELERRGTSLVAFGSSNKSLFERLRIRTHELGSLRGDSALASLYRAASVFVAPSMEDNLPNTVIEASACGVPSVAFDIGGMSDMIESGATGALAKAFDTRELGELILQVLGNSESYGAAATNRANRLFPLRLQGERYKLLYGRMLSADNR